MEKYFTKRIKNIFICFIACLINCFGFSHAIAIELELIATLDGNKLMGKFNQPFSLFIDEVKEKLYIVDTGNNRLMSFNAEFEYLARFDANGKLKKPISLVKNSLNHFFIILEGNELFFIDIGTKVFKKFEIKGAPASVNPILPSRLAIDKDDNLYLTDRGNGRILVLDRHGSCIREISLKNRFVDFSDVRVDTNGDIYTLSTLEGKVYVFNSRGETISSFGKRGNGARELAFPTSIAVDRKGLIYILDQHKGSIKIFEQNGNFLGHFFQNGWVPGELYSPSYIDTDDKDNLYIVDTGNNRVQIFHIKR